MAHNVLMRVTGDQWQDKNVNHSVNNPQTKQKFLAYIQKNNNTRPATYVQSSALH